MKTQFQIILLIVTFLSGNAAFAESTALQPQAQGDITFVSGGVGLDEVDAIHSLKPNYNLHLLFAISSGKYLSDIEVAIFDKKGNGYLQAVSLGPFMLVNLKPGSYYVKAQLDGKAIKKKVTVTGHKATSVSFIWPHE
ncbi:MAG: carboxypeptidase regulatory-like domain-containing protein [Methylococcaceae bacterium]|nr:carboxypeptidase regulatory-like domain-containing protein [Methylococcaceae bacterium]